MKNFNSNIHRNAYLTAVLYLFLIVVRKYIADIHFSSFTFGPKELPHYIYLSTKDLF
jgi:hypothetical protein